MPRIKSISSASKPKVKKPVRKSGAKPGPSAVAAPKKSKSVIVDVIEDEPLARSRSVIEEEYIDDDDAGNKRDDFDQQKKFFSDLVSEIKTKKAAGVKATSATATSRFKGILNSEEKDSKTSLREKKSRPSVGLYRRFVIKFLILLGFLALLVFFFFFSKLTVYITPSGETINDSLLLKVSAPASGAASTSTEAINEADKTDPRAAVTGEIKQITTGVEQKFPASGEEFTGEEMVGQVQIINNYNKSQALVAATRILSPDNKLFRLKEAVNVPAGGEATVAIYADKPGEELAIGPTTFTIPGLWLGLQDKIYARSDTAFTFEKKIQKYVKASDIDQAVKDINAALVKKAKEEINSSLTVGQTWLYNTSDPATVTVEAKVGDAQDEFLVAATGTITAVSFSKDDAAKLASATLNLLIPDNKELLDFQPNNIVYTLEDFSSSSESATIKASFSGTMVLKRDSQIINREQLVNLTAAQINTYLKSLPDIKSYSLKFSPSFIQKAPRLVDRIKVVVGE